jgi:DNA-directed RNA polymerase specialized sigma subunit
MASGGRDYYVIAKAAVYRVLGDWDKQNVEEITQELVLMLWELDNDLSEQHIRQIAKLRAVDATRNVLGHGIVKKDQVLRNARRSGLEALPMELDMVGSIHTKNVINSIESNLNDRDNYILEQYMEDKTMKQIAKELDCTEAAISQHLKNIKRKVEGMLE